MKNKLVKSFMGIGGLKLAGLPIGLAVSVLLARALGPEGFGHYAFIMSLVPLLALPVSGGLIQYLTREVARLKHDSDWVNYKALVKTAFLWVASLSIIAIIAFYALYFLGFNGAADPRWHFMMAAIFLVPLAGVNAVRTAVIKGLGKPFYSELPGLLIQPVISLLLIVLASYFYHLNTTAAINIQIVSGWLTFLVGSWILFRISPVAKGKAVPSFKLSALAKGVLPFSIMTAVSLFNTQIAIVMLGFMGSPEDVAGFRVAERGAVFITFGLTAINMTISPRLVSIYKQGDTVKMQRLVRFSSRMALLIALPLSIVFVAAGDEIISLLYGDAYAAIAYLPLVVLVVGQSVNVFCGPVGNILAMGGHERKSLRGHVLALATNLFLCVILIPHYGAVGGAIAAAAGVIVWNVVLSYFSIKLVGVKPFPV